MSKVAKRRILVVGCGALGGILIERLEQFTNVVGLDPSARVKNRRHIVTNAKALKGKSFDGLIVSTKCYDLESSLIPLKNTITAQRILFLQNGILNLSSIERLFPTTSFVRGVTTSAIGIPGGKPLFYYQGEFFVSPHQGKDSQAAMWFRQLFTEAGLNTSVVSNPQSIVWAKLIFSAVMNPLPVITSGGYDVLAKDPEIWRLVRQAAAEGRSVARALKIRLAFDPLQLISRVRTGDLAGIRHRGSIADDAFAHRKTELDFITGALVKQAHKLRVKVPALEFILKKAKAAGA